MGEQIKMNFHNSEHEDPEKKPHPAEKICRDLLENDLKKLKEKFGEINNDALLEGGYFRRRSTKIAQEVEWINAWVGKDIVKVSESDPERMTYVVRPQQDLDDYRNVV